MMWHCHCHPHSVSEDPHGNALDVQYPQSWLYSSSKDVVWCNRRVAIGMEPSKCRLMRHLTLHKPIGADRVACVCVR